MPFCIDGLSAAQLLYKASQRFRFHVGRRRVAAFGIEFRFQFFVFPCFGWGKQITKQKAHNAVKGNARDKESGKI